MNTLPRFFVRTIAVTTLIVLLACATQPVRAQPISFGDYYALVIGNNEYEYIEDLETAVADAKAMAHLLGEKYGFEVRLLLNANDEEIISAINDFRAQLTENDNLLVYYAGHGTIEAGTRDGFWLPVNAKEDNDLNWIENSRLTRRFAGMSAKHVIVISDSCYSGTLVRDAVAAPKTGAERLNWLRRMAEKRSRTALTSGALEPVVDGGGSGHSIFAEALIAVLREADDVIEADEVYRRLRLKVALNADQTPLYDPMKKAGHENGEFLFRPVRHSRTVPNSGTSDRAIELAFWNAISNSKDPGDYEAYLQQYPEGAFAVLAKRRVGRLAALTQTPKPSVPQPSQPVARPPAPNPLEPIESYFIALRNTNVRAEPKVSSRKIGTIARGNRVYVAGRVADKDWFAVESAGKPMGFIFAKLLQDEQSYNAEIRKNLEQEAQRKESERIAAIRRAEQAKLEEAKREREAEQARATAAREAARRQQVEEERRRAEAEAEKQAAADALAREEEEKRLAAALAARQAEEARAREAETARARAEAEKQARENAERERLAKEKAEAEKAKSVKTALLQLPKSHWIARETSCHSDGNTNASVSIVVTRGQSETVEAEIRIRSPLYQARSLVRAALQDSGAFSGRDGTTASALAGQFDRNGDLTSLRYGTCRNMTISREG